MKNIKVGTLFWKNWTSTGHVFLINVSKYEQSIKIWTVWNVMGNHYLMHTTGNYIRKSFWFHYLTTNNIYEQYSNLFPYMFLLYLGRPYILVHYFLYSNLNCLLLTSSRVFSIDLLFSVKHTVLTLIDTLFCLWQLS